MVEPQFEDAESFSMNYGKDQLTFRDIILQHLRKIAQFSSVEFRGGYWDYRAIHSNYQTNIVKTYIPDSREVYSNAVEALADLLYPYFDAEMHKEEKVCKDSLHKAFVRTTDSKVAEKKDDSDESVTIRVFKSEGNKLSYRESRRKIYRKLFRALCSFLYRKKYLELGTIED